MAKKLASGLMNKIISEYFSVRQHCVTGLNAAILDGGKKTSLTMKLSERLLTYIKGFQTITKDFKKYNGLLSYYNYKMT